MASGNVDSADLKGVLAGGLIRESVMEKIWDISKVPLTFTDLVGTGSADRKNEYIEWTQDTLADVDLTNAVIDGDDAGAAEAVSGKRVGNHSQISDKVVAVSHRADASTTIGRSKELGYQLMRRQQELRRDVEGISISNQASLADTGSAAGKVGGFPSWITTTTRNMADTGGFNTTTKVVDVGTAAAAAALSELWVRECIDGVYREGGDVTVMMSVPEVIGKFAQYLFTSTAQVATLYSDQGKSREKAAALSAVNVFITQHGTVRLLSNRLQQLYDNPTASGTDCADVFLIDPEYVALNYLEGYRTDTLAKTGLSNKRQMSVDWSLICHTENAHALIGGIDPTLAVLDVPA